MILTSLQKLSSNVGDLGKIIVATSFEWLPKVQKIAQSGHTVCDACVRHCSLPMTDRGAQKVVQLNLASNET